MGVLCWYLFWYASLYVLSSFAIILTRKRELVALLFVFWMPCYCKCPVALPQGAVGWSAVCDCGISWSYSLTFWLSNCQGQHCSFYPCNIQRRAMEVFFQRLEQGWNVINKILNNPIQITMTDQDKIDYEHTTQCWIWEQEIGSSKANSKERDHCHFTGKDHGAAHIFCNLKINTV